jgi:repressor of nif and glnA expression
MEKVGFVAGKVDTLGYQMSFNNRSATGTIIMNVSWILHRHVPRALSEIRQVFLKKLGMGTRLALIPPHAELGDTAVPGDAVGVATVCSVTVNGIMLHEGIPVTSRFGGLLEMRNGEPVRFVHLIEYEGTTLDPLEIFIKAGMTRVRQCAASGSGYVGASFREIPSVAIEDARRIGKAMEVHGMGGILKIGKPNQPLLDIPVAEGRAGMIVMGGLNPVAAVEESGIPVPLRSLAGLMPYDALDTFESVCSETP